MANTKIPVELSSTPGIVDNSNATAITIDSSENVGIGTASPSKKLTVSSDGVLDGITMSGANAPIISVTNTQTTSVARMLAQTTFSSLGTASNHPLVLITNDTERLRIDSSGNVGIGNTSPAAPLDIKLNTNSTADIFKFQRLDGAVAGVLNYSGTDGAISFGTTTSHDLTFDTANTERMRINSSGQLLVGTTAASDAQIISRTSGSSYNMYYQAPSLYASTYRFIRFQAGSSLSTVGSIESDGSTTTYNTSSDARLKDVTGEARGLEVINKLNPVAYNWKVDGKADEGLIAQEVMDIVPNAVSGSEEEMYQMDYSKLVVHLVKGMKEQQAQIEALQSEINLLKGE